MAKSDHFSIETNRPFDHLPLAPVVEAAIQVQARITGDWQPEALREKLCSSLPQFTSFELQHRLVLQAQFDADIPQPTASQKQVCHAVLAKNEATGIVAQISRDGLSFSQLQPYPGWDEFVVAARPVYETFIALTRPTDVQRLGVRFINRLDGVRSDNLGDFLREPPFCPRGLPVNRFLYQSAFLVPGHELGVNIAKTMQPSATAESALIIDIDVFTTAEFECGSQQIEQQLPAMRWLKNMVFFELLTPAAIDSFRGARP